MGGRVGWVGRKEAPEGGRPEHTQAGSWELIALKMSRMTEKSKNYFWSSKLKIYPFRKGNWFLPSVWILNILLFLVYYQLPVVRPRSYQRIKKVKEKPMEKWPNQIIGKCLIFLDLQYAYIITNAKMPDSFKIFFLVDGPSSQPFILLWLYLC